MKPTLLILAAGLGSRYGGVKQMDQIGPGGESIIDYSIYDAIQAGFKKVVFVLNPTIIDDFKEIYEHRLKGKIETEYVLQEVSNVPEGITFNPDRIKPWGTGHAVMMAKEVIQDPFAVINADDFYGREAFQTLCPYLESLENDSSAYAMVGYNIANTLSEHGTVSRGVCETKNGLLVDVVERTSIFRSNEGIVFEEDGMKILIEEYATVSMNFWGFTPLFFKQLENDFINFIHEHSGQLKSEFYIPLVVNNHILKNEASIHVLKSDAQWFGITYQEDKPLTIDKIRQLTETGIYPKGLWK